MDSHGSHLNIFLTKELVGWVYQHKDEGTGAESWHNQISPDSIIKTISENANWDPATLELLRQTPNKVVDWKLTWRDPQPQWTSKGGRIVQLGDSAHSFLPTSANGATQALEDSISLAECLRLGGKDMVPWSTKIHNKLR